VGLKEYFDRIYVINLPERTDRRRDMLRELQKVGLPLEPGKVEIFSAIRPSTAAGFANTGVRGCFLSHFNILRRAREAELKNVLIMEDDLTMSPRFLADAAGLVRQLQGTEWAFAYFGHIEKVEAAGPTALVPHAGPLRTTHFLSIDSTVFDRLFAFMELIQQRPAGHPDGGPMPVDGAYSTFRMQNPDVRTLIATPNLGWQRSSRSDLTPRWFDRVSVIRPVLTVARRLKNMTHRIA
jgi:hypothetical protein